ncbi:hypothetical protein GCM10018793_41410 [Streptomyces sulfonofaciens]|uniref:Uncharacterized protein n=1 Tax=Streptomyces sulfonofaciens TaxID=68272 RepID=A0A919GDI0_9ACTN|nr:hypothetical protein GCM10018793_41410 [Streptomyces sulfonofaciens]
MRARFAAQRVAQVVGGRTRGGAARVSGRGHFFAADAVTEYVATVPSCPGGSTAGPP